MNFKDGIFRQDFNFLNFSIYTLDSIFEGRGFLKHNCIIKLEIFASKLKIKIQQNAINH
jgi:hypothetical protein